MLSFRNVLCPTDFSEPSYEALRVAVEVALTFDAHLTIVHVVPTVPVLGAPVDGLGSLPLNVTAYVRDMTVQSEKLLAEIAHDRVPAEVQTRLVVASGDPADEILLAADRESADAIVIATHGWKGWRRFLFGSVAESVVRSALCPVLTIRHPVFRKHSAEPRVETIEA